MNETIEMLTQISKEHMKAIQITQPGNYHLVELPRPKPGSGDVLIKVAAVGICGTDIHIFKGEYEATYPIIPGHEFSGTIIEVGKRVKYFKPGDRVTADPNIPCHRCPACQHGYANQCENLEAVGVTRDGAFAEYVICPEEVVFHIGEMPFRIAAMVEPLACVVWGIKRVQIQLGDEALVFGAGPMGCMVAQALRNAGATRVVMSDLIDWRLELASRLGASKVVLGPDAFDAIKSINPNGFDIVVDATGVSHVLEKAFAFTRPRGKVWVFGVVPPGEKIYFTPYDVFRKDLSIIGSFAVNKTFPEAIKLIQGGLVKVEPLISHQLPLEAFGDAIHLAQKDPRRMKIQVQME